VARIETQLRDAERPDIMLNVASRRGSSGRCRIRAHVHAKPHERDRRRYSERSIDSANVASTIVLESPLPAAEGTERIDSTVGNLLLQRIDRGHGCGGCDFR